MRLSRICFKVAGGRTHDVIILFVNDFVNSFGARTVDKCPQLADLVNSFGGLAGLAVNIVRIFMNTCLLLTVRGTVQI